MSVPVLATNNQLNIQGVVSSNVNGTPSLSSTFPTSSTGTSQGHFQYTNPSTNSLKLLNACGSNTGGHEFWVSSSTSAPIQTAQIDASGITINNSTTSNVIYSPNVLLLSPDGKNIEVDGDLFSAPYNFQNQTFNPVYMTQTTALYTTGDLVYVVCGSEKVIQIFNNNNSTNPIPPNVVPSDFGNSSNVGITLGIPLFSLSASSPTTTKTSNLNEVLTIIEDTDESILSATDLTFNGNSLPSSVSTNTTNIATNTSNITTNRNNITNNTASIATNTSNISNNTANIATNTSNISSNTSNIANNTTNIATNTANIANINSNIQNVNAKIVVSQIQLTSSAIYADSSIAPQTSPYLNTYGYGGWAYSKKSPQSSNAKINWYFPFPINGGTVGDLKGLYYQIFNNCTNVGALPFFVVYTRPTGVNDAGSFFHSSMTYVCTTNSPANQTVQAYANIKNLSFTPNSINVQNQLPMSQSTVNNPRGTYLDTDVILFIAFGTNSISPLNSVDFSCSKIGMITNNFSSEFLLL